MDNEHKIIGYRDLTQDEIDLINEVKEKAMVVAELTTRINALPDIDKRWVAIGITDLQKGFMSINRAIAKPTTF